MINNPLGHTAKHVAIAFGVALAAVGGTCFMLDLPLTGGGLMFAILLAVVWGSFVLIDDETTP